MPLERVSFQATDGLLLEGWVVKADSLDRRWILMCHGVGSNHTDLLEIAQGLYEAGFNLLMINFRGHGGSAGRTTSFGLYEQRDLEGALVYLGQQADVPLRPYGIYGISMGAAVALMVAGKDERLAAIAADSPYFDLEQTIGRHLAMDYPFLPRIPTLWWVLSAYRLRFGRWPKHISPHQSVKQMTSRALLLIHGAMDNQVPVAQAHRLFIAAGGPKELWIVEKSDHLDAYGADPETYRIRLAHFFKRALLS